MRIINSILPFQIKSFGIVTIVDAETAINHFYKSEKKCITVPNWLGIHEREIQSEYGNATHPEVKEMLLFVFQEIVTIKRMSKRIVDHLTKSMGPTPNIGLNALRGMMSNARTRQEVSKKFEKMQTALNEFKRKVERCSESFGDKFFQGQLHQINHHIGKLATFARSNPSGESSISEKNQEVRKRILKPLITFNNKEDPIGLAIRCVEKYMPTYKAVRSYEHDSLFRFIDPNYRT